VRVRAKVSVEDIGRGKEALIVTELPYQVKKGGDGGVIRKIAELVHEKKITEISDLRDESDRRGMRIVIELKRGVIPQVVLNKLYKHTQLQTTFGVNTVALVDNVPRTLPLRGVIHFYVQHQREVIVRRSKYELRTLEAQVHRLEGLLIALDHLDAVIELIRSSPDRDAARSGLMESFGLTHIQAQAILELRLQQLTALEADTIRREHADKVERIRELRALLGDESKVLSLIKEELTEIRDRYGFERRTLITHSEDDLDIEDLIADEPNVITITRSGYIKRIKLDTYRAQRRGGVGITGMDMKEDDFIEHLFVCSTHEYLLFFTNRGKVYRSKVYDLPEMARTAKGRYLGNVLPLREGERVQSVLATRDFTESEFLIFATRNGTVKKTALQAYNTPIKADGIIAINIRDDDELVAVRRVDQGDEIIMVSHKGLAVRFKEEDARAMGRDTSGVRGMDVSGADNYVLAMDVATPGEDVLVVTENGYGKRTSIDEYRMTARGAKGVKTIAFTEAKGLLAAALVVKEHQDLIFISQNGMVQRTSVRGINRYGRTSQGVRVMNAREGDTVSAVALVQETEAPTAGLDVGADVPDTPIDGPDIPDGAGDGGVLAAEPDPGDAFEAGDEDLAPGSDGS
jgi:DNA gyrase subunit A